MGIDKQMILVRRTIDALLEKRAVFYPLRMDQYEDRNVQTLSKIMFHVCYRSNELKEHSLEDQLALIKRFDLPLLIEDCERGVFHKDQKCLDVLKTLNSSISKRRWKSGTLESFLAFAGEKGLCRMVGQLKELIVRMEWVISANEDILKYVRHFDMEQFLSCLEDENEEIVDEIIDGLVQFLEDVF
jgi:hypothetical protein